jgi:hypothetical protein
MTSWRQGTDVWLYPVTLVEDEIITWTETAGELSAIIPAGTYYCWAVSGAGGFYPSLLNTIASAMGGASFLFGNVVSYSFEARTPVLSAGLPWGGLALIGSKADFLSFDAGDTGDLIKRVLGFALNDPATYATTAGAGTKREIQGRLSRYGAWVSPEYATSRARTPRRLVDWSTEYTEREDAYAVDYGARTTREWVYEWILGAHVFASYALDLQYADAAGLYEGDVHNAFETVWASLARLDDVIVVHHLDGEPVDLAMFGHSYDVVRLADKAAAQDFRRLAELLRTAGEYYRLRIECSIRSSNNAY